MEKKSFDWKGKGIFDWKNLPMAEKKIGSDAKIPVPESPSAEGKKVPSLEKWKKVKKMGGKQE